ncbi:MAG: TSUP family transporter [Cyanobacteriota bacterium]|nr:TSUP family transporter [Cyanobacteriota bacterium]
MESPMFLLYLLLGLAAGALSGLIGIGGGVIIVPSLVYLFGFSQHEAQGTTLGLLVPPIGLLAAWTYYQQGYVNIKVAALVCVGFVLGGLLGAKLATNLSNVLLERVFGVALLLIALKALLMPSASR